MPTTTVKLDLVLQSNQFSNIAGLERVLQLLFGLVKAVDIGLMVFLVVKLHDFSANIGFQSLGGTSQ